MLLGCVNCQVSVNCSDNDNDRYGKSLSFWSEGKAHRWIAVARRTCPSARPGALGGRYIDGLDGLAPLARHRRHSGGVIGVVSFGGLGCFGAA